MVGRYVNVFLPGYSRILTLCEVEVYADPVPVENIALGKKTSQSSKSFRRKSDNAVDGERSTCCQTHTEADPWWRVDLLRPHNITSVTITNRDDNTAEMIDGAEIHIGNSLENNGNNNPLCTVISSHPAWETLTFQCHGMEGRYVSIYLPGCHKSLSLCEVEVNGMPVPENAASSGRATQSSQWDKFGDADNAIDRKRQVKCAVIPYIPAGQTRTYQCQGMEGRYVNILLPGSLRPLTLCEVEVNGTPL
ncbi:hypothetical protein JZ751_009626 [Albula glossodonta]|uniref:Fucolectin tachylectin-4 pentraxin-1 domain-containing protein n=1 Tax=Albula glossodonta TaxID=121402 RepID=A0A8T2NXN0_9TELE|nr:hypothetical protein JZ751_009626 [Albula glossodonta]